jgi:cytoskeletal protein CcmA (bactofilin family)
MKCRTKRENLGADVAAQESNLNQRNKDVMWKARPEDNQPMSTNQAQGTNASSSTVAATATPSFNAAPKEPSKNASYSERADVGHIGKSVVIRGELTGNEDLYLDGEIEGNIDLRDHKLVIGPNGKIKATITARDIVLHGRVEGNVSATERVELKKSCTLVGDVSTTRIVIEDGAFFKGAIDIKQEKDNRSEARKSSAASAGAASGTGMSGISYNAGSGSQGSFMDPK